MTGLEPADQGAGLLLGDLGAAVHGDQVRGLGEVAQRNLVLRVLPELPRSKRAVSPDAIADEVARHGRGNAR